MPLLEVQNLKKHFPIKKGILSRTIGHVRAVDGVSFSLQQGETLGLVGESGCGKTTVGRSILRLIEPTGGRVIFDGRDLLALDREELRRVRASIQIIFQDPFSSLNPRMNVGQLIAEPIKNHQNLPKGEVADRVAYLMEKVGFHPDQTHRYPHQFSGGQRQRIGIARALALSPLAIICDEPVSALDVSIQAQVINLLVNLQQEMNIAYLFIAHDLSVVAHMSDRIAVMYLGRIVEMAPAEALYRTPLHPYTRALLSAIPVADPDVRKEKILLEGDVPSPLDPPAGCAFHSRCPERREVCAHRVPSFELAGEAHWVECHLR
jgi:oligopeptide/dipeptide ABC transporter ATP-binding protein